MCIQQDAFQLHETEPPKLYKSGERKRIHWPHITFEMMHDACFSQGFYPYLENLGFSIIDCFSVLLFSSISSIPTYDPKGLPTVPEPPASMLAPRDVKIFILAVPGKSFEIHFVEKHVHDKSTLTLELWTGHYKAVYLAASIVVSGKIPILSVPSEEVIF